MRRRLLTLYIFSILLSVPVMAQRQLPKAIGTDSLRGKSDNTGTSGKALKLLEIARFWLDHEPEKAFYHVYEALRIAVAEKNMALKAEVFLTLGDYSSRRRHFLQAQQQYLSAANNYQYINDTIGIIQSLLKIGYLNQSLKHYESSIVFFNQALRLSQKMKNFEQQGQSLSNLAIVYELQGDHKTAESFLMNAISFLQKSGNKTQELAVRSYKGVILLDEKKFDEALLYYQDLLGSFSPESERILGSVYTRIGHIYDQKKNFAMSLLYNRKALEIRNKIGIQFDISSSYINIAGDFFNLNKLDSAMFYLNIGMAMAKKNNQLNILVNGYRHLYIYYSKKNDFRQTIKYYRQYAALYEELLVEQSKTHIGIIEARQKLQREVESGKRLCQKNRIQSLTLANQQFPFFIVRVLAIVAGIVLIVICFIYFYNYRARHRMQTTHEHLTQEISERKLKEQQTKEAEMKFRFLSENSIDFITHINSDMQRIYASPACLTLYGYDCKEILNKTTNDLTNPDFHADIAAIQREMITARSERQFVYKALKKDGTSFWVETVMNPLFNAATGEFKGMVGVTRDIQERKTKEFEIMEGTKQKENLLKEIHHRVKNNFAILVSLINMQMTQIKEPSALKSLTNLQLRIRSMSLVHEMLYRSHDFEKISFPEYLRSLAAVISGAFGRRDVTLIIEAEEAVMNIDASIPLGLIVNELLSNAYMHAFPDGKAGKIFLGFFCGPENSHYRLIIQDDGVGLPKGFSIEDVKTMGLQIVQLLSRQIEGIVTIENNPGASFSITFQT
ncbi:MAG: PAS domain S-box protein [Bacteroidetes bacterium]|nr:PAS domain S-box protein [Bacteroidota bacterium]